MKKKFYSLLITSITLLGICNSYGQTIITIAGNGTASLTYGCCGNGGAATAAQFNYLTPAIALDPSGNLYVSDQNGGQIRKVNSAGIIDVFAGMPGLGSAGDGGQATAAYIDYPSWLTFDASGNLYLVEEGMGFIRKINTSGIITKVAGAVSGAAPLGDGGPATDANLYGPGALVVDVSGNIYFGCYGSPRVRKIDATGIIRTIAGTGVYGYSGDHGPATAAKFSNIKGMAMDASGNIFVADYYNHAIRKISTTGIVTTIAGNGTAGFSGDGGPASAAMLNFPNGIKFDSHGNLFIADQQNERIRVINTAGIINTVAGCGIIGYSGDGGAATLAKFFAPSDIAIDPAGNIYITDDSN